MYLVKSDDQIMNKLIYNDPSYLSVAISEDAPLKGETQPHHTKRMDELVRSDPSDSVSSSSESRLSRCSSARSGPVST